jgi:dolichyl-phosphate-mannose-protein mannosyltransferase
VRLEWLWRFRRSIMLTSVGVLAALLRFVGLGWPKALVFDELYYARGAYSLLHQGYEGFWGSKADAFAGGDFSGLEVRPDFVVHPPLGKWMIAVGEKAFGATPFGWRFSSAAIGTITVVLLAIIATHLFRSVLWGGVAGLFLAVDGQHVVASRTALLDIFLTFFVVAGFGLFLLDRRRTRRKLEEKAAAERARLGLSADAPIPGRGPRVGVHWWRLAGLATLGFATGVKWSGAAFAVVFVGVALVWDYVDRKRAGFEGALAATIVRSVVPTAVAAILIVPTAYVATWTSWFLSDNSYDRYWAQSHEGQGITWLPETARSFVAYHEAMYDFHKTLTHSRGVTHGYAANPWGFILQAQSTAYYWETDSVDPRAKCGASNECVSAITALGNPLLWWAGAAAFAYAVFRSIFKRDLLALVVVSGTIAGWVPWLFVPDRVMFTFYSVAFAPWVMLTLTWALMRIARPPRLEGAYSRRGGIAVAGFVAAALVIAAFFLPLYTGQWIPYDYWLSHMWLGDWWI